MYSRTNLANLGSSSFTLRTLSARFGKKSYFTGPVFRIVSLSAFDCSRSGRIESDRGSMLQAITTRPSHGTEGTELRYFSS